MSATSSLSVIVATYEWPEALDVVLTALSEQPGDFEIVVADDGSGPETKAVFERWQASLGNRVFHAWQPDEGYRRARCLNLAATVASGRYLLYIDGDCIPRRGFLDAVRRCVLPGWFVASKRLHLSEALSRRVLEDRVPVWRWSAARWLLGAPRELFTTHRESARLGLLVPIRDRRRPWRSRQPEFSPPYDAYGFCLGVSREDFERVNGFDVRFEGWGGEDVDLAARLRGTGLRCGWPGPAATMLHLWHAEAGGQVSA